MENASTLYEKFYKSIDFERKEVFEYIQKTYSPHNVIYPGSSIHITPSFYFQHVVYIDISKLAQSFFDTLQEVKALIAANQKSGKNHYIKFIKEDFTKPLPLQEKSFDLLVSIFSGEQIRHCEKYLKINGLILTTDLFSDWGHLQDSNRFVLIDTFMVKNGKIIPIQDTKKHHKHLKMKKSHNGFSYVDNQTYYLYKKAS